MRFNYGYEKKKFEEDWERYDREYRKAGMSDESIYQMYVYDWEMFKRDRIYRMHTQYMDIHALEEAERKNPLMYRFFDRVAVPAKEVDPDRRYGWVDELNDERLWQIIHGMSKSSLELLTLYAIYGYTIYEIADMQSVSPQAISKRLNRIKKKLKNI